MKNAKDQVSGAELLVQCLEAQNTKHVFLVPGESYLAVLDALVDAPVIDITVCRQEGGAAMMAEAHGKLTGRPGICMVTRGPGTTNATAGLHIAYQDATPMILFIGQVARSMRDREAFQEIEYRSMLGEVTKWVAEIDQPDRIPEIISRAFHVACNGRPGPVAISLPEDMLTEMTGRLTPASPAELSLSTIHEDHAGRLQELLQSAERPLLIVGGGQWSADAKEDLENFAESWGLPVAASFRCQDFFSNAHPNYVGEAGIGINPSLANRIEEADVLILLGTRLSEMESSGYRLVQIPEPAQTLVHIYPDANEIGKMYRPTIGIAASPVDIVKSLASLPGTARITDQRQALISEARAEFETWTVLPEGIGALRMPDIMRSLETMLPTDAILTNGAGNYTIWVHRYHRYNHYRTQLAPISGSMGYGLPAAIAAARIHPDRTVVCLAGDGCFLMHGQELATAVKYNLNLIILVINNGMYGTIRTHQERHYPGRVSATDLTNPDFAILAQAYGCMGEAVTESDAFPEAFARAMAASGPALLELRVDPEALLPTQSLSEIRDHATQSAT
jgi:acetolactate synthase I/II/III large subunit